MDYSIDWQNDTAVFTIHNEASLNALKKVTLDALSELMDQLEAGKGRALIVTAKGDRAFSAGTDLLEAASLTQAQSTEKTRNARALFVRMHRSSVISVAAINGLAYGGGLELAMACTFRVAVPHAKLSLPEVKLAVLPAYGGTQLLPAIVGRANALDMMLSGRSVKTDEALRMGLVSRVSEAGVPVLDEAKALLATILCNSQFTLNCIQATVAASSDTVLDEGLAVEQQEFEKAANSNDAAEGINAFLEKRPANFSHS